MRSYINRTGFASNGCSEALVIIKDDETYISLPLTNGEYVTESFPSERFLKFITEAQSNGLVTAYWDGQKHHIMPAEDTIRLAA